MIFETQLGIKPSEWLKYAPLDDFLGENRIPVLPFEDAMVSISGLHITLLRLILASFFSIGAGILHRCVPTATGAVFLVLDRLPPTCGCHTCGPQRLRKHDILSLKSTCLLYTQACRVAL